MPHEVKIMLSNRHMHLTQEVCQTLFGYSEPTLLRDLGGGEYSAKETVTLVGPKGKIEGVRVLGGCRNFTQVELFKGDCFVLGIDAPIRESGDLADAAPLKIIGSAGEVELEHCAIVALRHIHIGQAAMEELNLRDRQMVCMRVGGERGLVFDQVLVRASRGNGRGVAHLDMEEGNAAALKNGDIGEMLLPTDLVG